MKYKEIFGDLITLGQARKFDVVAQGNNCWCVQGAGLAPQFVKAFGTDKFSMEDQKYAGNVNKLGTIDYQIVRVEKGFPLLVVNCYTQFGFGSNHSNGTSKPVDYEAITLCMRKMNHEFKGKHIGLPKIGAGLGGGNWRKIKGIIKRELYNCDITVVILPKKKR